MSVIFFPVYEVQAGQTPKEIDDAHNISPLLSLRNCLSDGLNILPYIIFYFYNLEGNRTSVRPVAHRRVSQVILNVFPSIGTTDDILFVSFPFSVPLHERI